MQVWLPFPIFNGGIPDSLSSVFPSVKNIALLVPGGIGTGDSEESIPAVRSFAEKMAQCVRLTIFSLHPAGSSRPVLHGATVVPIPVAHDESSASKVMSLVNAVLQHRSDGPFDVVHGLWALPCGLAAVVAAQLRGIRSVVSLQGGETADLPVLSYGNMRSTILRQVTLTVCRLASSVTTLSDHQRGELRSRGVRRPDIVAIPYGVPSDQFHPSKKEIAEGPLHLLCVGNINPLKHHETAIRSLARIRQERDAMLRIVGENQRNAEIVDLARGLGVADNLELTGRIPHCQLPTHYDWAHMLIHPSLHEAQGVVVAEATASGVVPIGTPVGLIADFEPDKAATFPFCDHEALADRVLALAGDPGRYSAIRDAGLRWSEDHSIDWTVDQFIRIYDRPASH